MSWTLAGKHVLITGATNGIGLAAAEAMARKGARLTIVGRNPQKTEAALDAIRKAGGAGTEVGALIADLSTAAGVRALAAEALARLPRIDILANNAGAYFTSRRTSADGRELTWATNHLAPFLLTNLLLDRLKASAPARVITTASDAHLGASIPFDDVDAERRYRGFRRYGATKLANILFTAELARRLAGTGVSAYAFHPGFVLTGFLQDTPAPVRGFFNLIRPLIRNPEKGAETLVWLAETDLPPEANGGYFMDRKPRRSSAAAKDMASATRLWDVSLGQVGLAG